MDPVVDTSVRIGLAWLLLGAALHKARGFREFVPTLAAYRLLPERASAAAAAAVIALELGIGAMLLAPALWTTALLGAVALLALYSAAISVNLLRGRRHIDCGCSGPARRQPLSQWLLVRNGLLIALGLLALWPAPTRSLTWFDGVTIAAAVAVAGAAYATSNQLVANAPDLARLRPGG